jgi:hypothetical protein
MNSSVFFDVRNGAVWLRIEIEDFHESGGMIFENDIVNIKLEGGIISVQCLVYSHFFGGEIIAFHHNEMSEFDPSIFKNMEERLTAEIKEHIFFYMSRI